VGPQNVGVRCGPPLGMGPQKTPSCSLYDTKFGRSKSNCVGVSRGPKHFGDAGPLSLGIAAWLTPRNTLLPHVCYYTKFGRSRSNDIGASRRFQNFLEALGPRHIRKSMFLGATTSETCLTHLSYRANFGHSVWNCRSVINGDPPKIDPWCLTFLGHSR